MTLRDLLTHLAVHAQESDGWGGEIPVQITALRPGETKTGKPYLDLEIGDGTANEKIKLWSDSPAYAEALRHTPGTFVALDAHFHRNQYGLNLSRPQLRPLTADETAALLEGPAERRAFIDAEIAHITATVDAFTDPRLRLLGQTFLQQYAEKFRRAAAARDYHHARRGGLVEHVVQMMRSAQALRPVYPHLNWDLVLLGVLFHDSGKLWENDYQAEGFLMPHTLVGELMGHIPVGIELANSLWRTLHERPEFKALTGPGHQPPAETVRLHLLHLIASHHGQREYGAPVTPRTAEAWALHYIDNLDAKMEMLRSAFAEKPQIAPGIHERRAPLEGHPVVSLPPYLPPLEEPPIA